MTKVLRALAIALSVSILPLQAVAQSAGAPRTSVLIINSERLFEDSAFGQRVLAEQQAEAAVLAAEYRRIEAELTEEERNLTEKRSTMDPADFRKVADAFDERVESIRATQQQREIDLIRRGDEERQRFLNLLRPVFEAILSETGAAAVLEERTVFARNRALDITDSMIEQADLLLGDGVVENLETDIDEN